MKQERAHATFSKGLMGWGKEGTDMGQAPAIIAMACMSWPIGASAAWLAAGSTPARTIAKAKIHFTQETYTLYP